MTAGPDCGRAAFQSRVRPRLPAVSGISTLTLVLRKKAISAYQGQRTLRVLEALISEEYILILILSCFYLSST